MDFTQAPPTEPGPGSAPAITSVPRPKAISIYTRRPAPPTNPATATPPRTAPPSSHHPGQTGSAAPAPPRTSGPQGGIQGTGGLKANSGAETDPGAAQFAPIGRFVPNAQVFTRVATTPAYHIPTGLDQFDKITGGGLPTNRISEISSLPQLGKTQIAIQSALSACLPAQLHRTVRNLPLNWLSYRQAMAFPECELDNEKTGLRCSQLELAHSDSLLQAPVVCYRVNALQYETSSLSTNAQGSTATGPTAVPSSSSSASGHPTPHSNALTPPTNNPRRLAPVQITHQLPHSHINSASPPPHLHSHPSPTLPSSPPPPPDTHAIYLHCDQIDPVRFEASAAVVAHNAILNHALLDAFGQFEPELGEYVIIPPPGQIPAPRAEDWVQDNGVADLETGERAQNSPDQPTSTGEAAGELTRRDVLFVSKHFSYLSALTGFYNSFLPSMSTPDSPLAPLDLNNPRHMGFIKQLFLSAVAKFAWNPHYYLQLDLYYITQGLCSCTHRWVRPLDGIGQETKTLEVGEILALIHNHTITPANWPHYLHPDAPCTCQSTLAAIPYPDISPRSLLRRCVAKATPNLRALLTALSDIASRCGGKPQVKVPKDLPPEETLYCKQTGLHTTCGGVPTSTTPIPSRETVKTVPQGAAASTTSAPIKKTPPPSTPSASPLHYCPCFPLKPSPCLLSGASIQPEGQAAQASLYPGADLVDAQLAPLHPDAGLASSRLAFLCVDNIALFLRAADSQALFMNSLACLVDSLNALLRVDPRVHNVAVLCLNQVTTLDIKTSMLPQPTWMLPQSIDAANGHPGGVLQRLALQDSSMLVDHLLEKSLIRGTVDSSVQNQSSVSSRTAQSSQLGNAAFSHHSALKMAPGRVAHDLLAQSKAAAGLGAVGEASKQTVPAMGQKWGSVVHHRFLLQAMTLRQTRHGEHYSLVYDPLGRADAVAPVLAQGRGIKMSKNRSDRSKHSLHLDQQRHDDGNSDYSDAIDSPHSDQDGGLDTFDSPSRYQRSRARGSTRTTESLAISQVEYSPDLFQILPHGHAVGQNPYKVAYRLDRVTGFASTAQSRLNPTLGDSVSAEQMLALAASVPSGWEEARRLKLHQHTTHQPLSKRQQQQQPHRHTVPSSDSLGNGVDASMDDGSGSDVHTRDQSHYRDHNHDDHMHMRDRNDYRHLDDNTDNEDDVPVVARPPKMTRREHSSSVSSRDQVHSAQPLSQSIAKSPAATVRPTSTGSSEASTTEAKKAEVATGAQETVPRGSSLKSSDSGSEPGSGVESESRVEVSKPSPRRSSSPQPLSPPPYRRSRRQSQQAPDVNMYSSSDSDIEVKGVVFQSPMTLGKESNRGLGRSQSATSKAKGARGDKPVTIKSPHQAQSRLNPHQTPRRSARLRSTHSQAQVEVPTQLKSQARLEKPLSQRNTSRRSQSGDERKDDGGLG